MSREISPEEARVDLLIQMQTISNYWAKQKDMTDRQKCDGIVFSILTIFDGGAMGIPAIDLNLSPHPEDKQYSIENNQNWYCEGQLINDCQLHEIWCSL